MDFSESLPVCVWWLTHVKFSIKSVLALKAPFFGPILVAIYLFVCVCCFVIVLWKARDFSETCRTCLGSKELNPIFVNIEEYKRYSSALLIVAGIKVEISDGLPQNMCTNCIKTLNNSLKFRKQCKDAETQLLEQIKISNFSIDRSEDIYLSNKYDLDSDITILEVLEPEPETKDVNDIPDDTEDDEDKPLKDFIEDGQDFCDAQEVDNLLNVSIESQDNLVPLKELKKKRTKRKDLAEEKEPPYREAFSADANKQRVTCKICQKDLSIRSIDTHMARMHPGADERKVKCELCDRYVFGNKMRRHLVMMHGSQGALRCGYCKSEFEGREALMDHVTSCTEKKKKRKASEAGRQLQQCDVCNKTMQRASLRMHKAIKHAGLGPVCEHCGIKFGNKFRLDEHYRAKHGYEKFRCGYCDFRSASLAAMRNHERRHRGEKPFVCDAEACGAKFHAAYLLAQHKQSHRTEKLVKCDRCSARFKARNSLHAHRLARHARAPAACALCAATYACRHYAARHARRAHKVLDAHAVVI